MSDILTKEDYFRAAELVANCKAHSIDYVIQILSNIIPLKVLIKMDRTLSPAEIKQLVELDPRPVPEIANSIGVGRNTIYRWMKGERKPSREMLDKLLEELQSVEITEELGHE